MKRSEAIALAARHEIPLTADFDTLPASTVDRIIAAADERKYRKPRDANGSRARYFHAYLVRSLGKVEDAADVATIGQKERGAMTQYIVSACHDGKRIRSDVFEATSMHVAMEHAKAAWPELATLSWLGEQGEDYPAEVARLLSWFPYVVTYMVRKRTAIGIFYATRFNVKAPDEAAALQAAFTLAQALGYETREPVGVLRKL